MLDDCRHIKRETEMLRIVNAKRALEAKQYLQMEGAFSILVNDSLEWNRGIYDVCYGGGSCRVQKRTSGAYDIAVDAHALARLLIGEAHIDSPCMRLISGMQVVSNREVLDDVFIQRPLLNTELY